MFKAFTAQRIAPSISRPTRRVCAGLWMTGLVSSISAGLGPAHAEDEAGAWFKTSQQCLAETNSGVSGADQIEACTRLLSRPAMDDAGRAWTFFNRGCAYMKLGNLDEAIADFKQSLSVRPDIPPVLNNLGIAYKAKGDLDAAMDAFNKAIAIEPRANAYASRAQAWAERQNFAEAIADAGKAIAMSPDNSVFRLERGNYRIQSGDHEAAIADYSDAVRLAPNEAIAFNNRGWVYEQLGRNVEALADYDAALKLRPDYSNAQAGRERLAK